MVSHSIDVVRCIVPGCGNTDLLCPGKRFFLFSSDEERCNHWLLVCKREDLLENASAHSEFAVCCDHFIGDHFQDKSHTKLRDNAVPTIFPPSEQALHFSSQINIADDGIVLIKSEDNPFVIYDINDDGDQEATNNDTSGDMKNVKYLCRLCANEAEEIVYLFNSPGQDLHLARKINATLPVTVHDSDPLPKQLCSLCVIKVNMCHEFAEMCLMAESKLISLMKNNAFQAYQVSGDVSHMTGIVASELGQNFSSITVVEGGSECNYSKNNSGKKNPCRTLGKRHASSDNFLSENVEIGEESLLFSCPLCPEGTVSVKDTEESLLVGEKMAQNNGTQVNEICSQNDLYQNTSFKNSSAVINVSPSSRTRKLKVNALKKVSLQGKNGYCVRTKNNSKSMEKDISIEILNSKIVANSGSVCCCICQESFDTFDLCLHHSKTHFSDGNYPCSICGKFFSSEIDHSHHYQLHAFAAKKFSLNGKRLKCDNCERQFMNLRTFSKHPCVSADPKQYRCNLCKKSYSTPERLIFHQKFHEGARQYLCDQCGKEFDNEGTLYYHTRMVHVGERPFSCNICGKKFYSNSRLVAHKRVHTGERPFGCEICGRKFYDRDTLKGHYVTHMAVKPFQCDFCGVCWSRKSLLNQHIRTRHSDDNSASRRMPSLIHYFCKICNTTFTNSTDVFVHRTTHWKTNSTAKGKDSNVHFCEYCSDSFASVSILVKHRKQKHPDEKPYSCTLCNARSHTLYEARVHKNKHSLSNEVKQVSKEEKISTFICEACGNIFTEKRRFMRHMREHKDKHSYKCGVCEKQFIDKQRLRVHMRLHTGEKPYTCNVCGKSFSQTSALYTHALLHTGEKPHSCDLCGKAFRIKADRDNHRRTHTGEKPYNCEFCGKTFRTGQVYYQHRMIHTGERRFPCNICGKAFKRSHTLVVHKRIHTGEKPNICDICGKGFRQRSDMKKHRTLHIAKN